jgi:hypothetical protein
MKPRRFRLSHCMVGNREYVLVWVWAPRHKVWAKCRLCTTMQEAIEGVDVELRMGWI